MELPILEEQYQEQRKTDKEFHIEQEDQAVSRIFWCALIRVVSLASV